jgi:DUF4097 and DUF4098 domain-containing protein YvlB
MTPQQARRTSIMTRTPLAFATAVACAIALGAPAAAQQRETETVERTAALPSGGTLSLKNFSGDVRITAGRSNDVVIKAVRRATRDRLDHIKLDVSSSGSTVFIDANKRDPTWEDRNNNVVETEFDIQVPAGARLDVDVFSSDLTVTDVTGEQTLKTFSGAITVTGARGPVDAKTFSADVEIDATAQGAEPRLSVETFSGDIVARLATGARGRVDFRSFSGSFESDLTLQMQSSRRRNISADLPGGSGQTLRFKTFSGSLRIRN